MRRFMRAVLFLLPVSILLPHLEQFSFQPGAAFSDFVVSHYPNALFLQRAVAASGQIPFWAPNILGGYPFIADPLSGVFYLPGWLSLLFPLPLGINLILALHLIWGGLGMYMLLRAEGLTERAGMFGALLFEAMPKLFSHIGAGHVTLIYAVTWTPWLLYVERRSFFRPPARWMLTGMVLGAIVLADVRWAAYAGLFWAIYSLRNYLNLQRDNGEIRTVDRMGFISWLSSHFGSGLVALLVAAPLLLPLAQYTALATRQSMTGADTLTLSMPPGQLFGLLYPNIGGMAEWVLYPGAVMLVLSITAAVRPSLRRAAGFWLALIPVTFLIALGTYLPFAQMLGQLPGFNLLRVPPRVLFLTGLCFPAAAAMVVQALEVGESDGKSPGKDRTGLVLFGLGAFVVMLAGAAWLVVHQPLPLIQFTWGAVAFCAVTAVILLARSNRLAPRVAIPALFVLALVDLIGVNGLSLDFRSQDAVFSYGKEEAEYVKSAGGEAPFRVYSPSYSLPQHVAAYYGLELVDGVDPLQLEGYVRFMEKATGVPNTTYSVTMPPFPNADPKTDNRMYQPDAHLLGLLNVKYIVSAFPLQEKGIRFATRTASTWIYENLQVLPRAWVQAFDAEPGQQIHDVPVIQGEANRIDLQARGPGLLVLSEINYPGWRVRVDGQTAEVETVAGILRGVQLAPGTHQVRFTFRPWPLFAGLALAFFAWIGFGLAIWNSISAQKKAEMPTVEQEVAVL